MNSTAKQPTLFDREQPRSLECSGPELAAKLADLKHRGAHVTAMQNFNNSGWHLSIQWPLAEVPQSGKVKTTSANFWVPGG